jgi:hypothetical protein
LGINSLVYIHQGKRAYGGGDTLASGDILRLPARHKQCAQKHEYKQNRAARNRALPIPPTAVAAKIIPHETSYTTHYCIGMTKLNARSQP